MGPNSGWLLLTLACSLLVAPVLAAAQQAGKTARVGWVTFSPGSEAGPRTSALDGFRDGLRERGWIEGKNIVLDVRTGDRGDAAAIAKEFVGNKTDVIFADGAMVNGLKSQAGETPIVFTMSGDPLEAKWVATLARPGGNVTGLSSLHLELEAKRLELLKEIRPGLARVAVLANERHPGYQAQLKAAQTAAQQLGLTLQLVPVRTAGDFEQAFGAMAKGGAEAILVFSDSLVNFHANATAIAEFAERRRIASVSAWPSFVEAGNLLTYGPNEREFFQRAAAYIDRILRGAKPADLPVEFPTRLMLTVNRKAARALGLTIPQSVLVRADRVIE
jgi:putative ABC transport system substrate-binding protein